MKAPCVGMQGKMLPSVTVEDNGDVLTVVDGEWSKASGGDGDTGEGVFFVKIESVGEDEYAADKTFAEIANAYNNGKLIVCYEADGDNLFYYYLDSAMLEEGNPIGFTFKAVLIGHGSTASIGLRLNTI